MKRGLTILILCLALRGKADVYPLTNSTEMSFNWASYGTGPYLCVGETIGQWDFSMYPQWLHCLFDWGQSGGNIQSDWQNNMFRYCGPFWHAWTNGGPIYNFFDLSENGGFSTNAAIQWSTNLINATTAIAGWWNGGYTNEGVSFPPISHIAIGAINENAYSDPNANLQYAQTATFLPSLGWPVIIAPTWYLTWTNGLSTDSSHLFGYYPGQHPYRGGGLAMALWILLSPGINAETNIWNMTVDFAAQTISTNHLVISSPAFTADSVTFTVHLDRMGPGWDNTGNTNNAQTCFQIFPMLANQFRQIIQFSNLPTAGTWNCYLDGQLWASASAAQWAAGVNTFTNFNGPVGAQRMQLLYDMRDAYGLDHATLNQVGQAGPLGPNIIGEQSNAHVYPATYTGTNYINVMSSTFGWPNNYYKYMTNMFNHAQQTNHTLLLRPAYQVNTKTNTVGTLHFGT